MSTQRRRDREKAQRRQDILRAAQSLFWELGYEKTTMARVAAAAELAPGTVYLYFPSKDSLYLALLGDGYELLLAQLKRAVAGASSPVEASEKLVDTFLDFARQQPAYFDILIFALRFGKQPAVRFPEAQLNHLAQMDLACKTVGIEVLRRLGHPAPQVGVQAIWAMLAGMVHFFRDDPEYDAVAAEARRIILRSVSAQAPGAERAGSVPQT